MSIHTNERNPYAPPQANVELAPAPPAEAPPLWNPGAASAWSLIFTPVFGALLHMKNWQALGEPQKAAVSRVWAWGGVIFIILLTIAEVIWDEMGRLDRFSGLIFLSAWYSASGKSQQTYVRERFGKNYPRRGWARPLLLALAAFVVVVVVAVVFLAIFVDVD